MTDNALSLEILGTQIKADQQRVNERVTEFGNVLSSLRQNGAEQRAVDQQLAASVADIVKSATGKPSGPTDAQGAVHALRNPASRQEAVQLYGLSRLNCLSQLWEARKRQLTEQPEGARKHPRSQPSTASARLDRRPRQRRKFNDYAGKPEQDTRLATWSNDRPEDFTCQLDGWLKEPLPQFFKQWIDGCTRSASTGKPLLPTGLLREGKLETGHCYYKGCNRSGHRWDQCPRLAVHVAKNPADPSLEIASDEEVVQEEAMETELPSLGHIIGRDGVKPDPRKVQSVVDWPTPTCLRKVLQFLGLTNFFIKFVQGYANLTQPLTDLSKKDAQFDWTPSCNSAFRALKRALTTAPVLAFPDPDKPFELECDASGFGLGAVLLREGRPLGYYSRKMTAAERIYVVTEQELLATVEALRVFRCYLLSGKQFNLVTDNMPNTFLQTQPVLSRRQAHWSEYLQRFHVKWVHKAGRHNVADPLSRNPDSKSINALLAVTTRGSTGKRSVQELHSGPAPDFPASQAGQKRRRGASTPATGANTIPLDATSKQHSADCANSSSSSGSDSQDAQQSSAAADALPDVSLIDDLVEAYAADPYFADATKTAGLTYAQELWWKGDRIVVPNSVDTKRLILQAFHDHPMAGHFGVTKTLKVACNDKSDAVDWADMYVEHVVQHEGLSTVIISDRGPQFKCFQQGFGCSPGHKLEPFYSTSPPN
ncbi:hypothetical protein WJX77_009904 [Trebouxia sp. C0004]